MRLRFFYPALSILVACLCANQFAGCSEPSSSNSSSEDSSHLSHTESLTISSGVSPEVRYRIDTSDSEALSILIEVESMQATWPAPEVEVGLSAEQTVLLASDETSVRTNDGIYEYRFVVKRVDLLSASASLDSLRFGFTVKWINPLREVIQHENFLFREGMAAFAPLGVDPMAWKSFSLQEYDRLITNLSRQIRLKWKQPMEGKATIVIDDAKGHRVRNLVSGQRFSAGLHTVIWDGLNEAGQLVEPGDYRWQVVTHPGIQPEFKMSYYNPGQPGWKDGPTSMWLGDHSSPEAAASNGEFIALGCPIAESGNNIAIVDQQGNKVNDANTSSHMGHGRIFLAMDQNRFYAFCEGAPSYSKIRKDENGQAYLYASLNLIAWDLEDGREHRYQNGRQTYKVVREYRLDPAVGRGHAVKHNMRGCVFINGVLYLSLYDEDQILMLNPETGEEIGAISLRAPGAMASDGEQLLVYSGSNLVLYEQPGVDAKPRALFTPDLSEPRKGEEADTVAASLAFSPEGLIYAGDDGIDQNIKVYNLQGQRIREIGQVGGGVEEGEWAPNSVRHPTGMALDEAGQLWVAENHARPKRVSIWDASQGSLNQELFGPAHYGASGAGFDTADITKWLGGASIWDIDIDAGEAQLRSVLFSGDKPGMPTDSFYPFSAWYLHKDGRTFLIAKDAVMRFYELMPEGHAKLWAMFGSLHAYEAESPRWWVPEVFTQHPQLKDVLVDFTEPVGAYGNFRNGPAASKGGRELSVMWIDRNGDNAAQVDELQVAGDAGHKFRGSIWGYHFEDTLDWKLWVDLTDGVSGLGKLTFNGWLPSGAPDWNWTDAVMQAKPVDGVDLQRGPQAYLLDRQGRMLVNSHPMLGISPDNEVVWTFPNDWNGVHGSQKAPLPVTGVLQGALSYLGSAPFDEQGDVTIINGNHGRFFVMTTDGIYLDEIFQDVRLSRDASAYRIGGETFGGYFGRDQASGRYILQSGHSDYRIFEIHGFEQVQRETHELTVSAEQVSAAQTVLETVKAKAQVARVADIPNAKVSTETTVAEWGDASQRFPYANVVAYRDETNLVLRYVVNDPSPWVNNGKDRNLLFKTGDVVVFEFSTDPNARLKRSQPVVGDKRLMVAPFEGESIAMLYDYQVPGVSDPVAFNSPWRAALVDQVQQIESAVIDVQHSSRAYVLTVSIPLAELGLPESAQSISLLGDFGVIYGDDAGHINVLRSYWSNQATGLVNDVPGETMINPSFWGELNWK